MKHIYKSLLYAMLLLATGAQIMANCSGCTTATCGDDCSPCGGCTTLYLPRPQIDNLAFLMAGETPYEANKECFSWSFYLGYHFDRSMSGSRNTIASCLFGNDTVHFKGSETVLTGTNATVLIADYLGMGTDTNLDWSPCPRIQSHNVDFAFRFMFDEWVTGLWLDVRFPLQIAKWQLDLNTSSTFNSCNDCSSDCASNCDDSCSVSCDNDANCGTCNGCGNGIEGDIGTVDFFPGYMGPVTSGTTTVYGPEVAVATSLPEALSGTFSFGDMTGFTYSRVTFNNDKYVTKLADISFNIGYDFLACDDYHLALYLRIVAPTGTRLDRDYAQGFFCPIIGNGHHVEFGAGVRGHVRLWDWNDNNHLVAKLEGYVTHLFADKCEARTFDFAGKGCLSRYMLLKQFSQHPYAYDDALVSGVEYSTRNVEVTIAAKGEAAVKFEWNYCNWIFGLGVEVWGRSAETICGDSIEEPISPLFNAADVYGFKGGTAVGEQGYSLTGGTTLAAATTPSSARYEFVATAGNATASFIGTVDSAESLVNTSNPGAYFPNPRTINMADNLIGTTLAALGGASSAVQISSSTTPTVAATSALVTGETPAPVLLPARGYSALDIDSGLTASQFTAKLFGDISYRWECDWQPVLSLYGMGEWAPNSYCCALSQWSVGLRGGITF